MPSTKYRYTFEAIDNQGEALPRWTVELSNESEAEDLAFETVRNDPNLMEVSYTIQTSRY